MELEPGTVPVKSLRERRKEETARELRQTALRLFQRDGFSATSVDDIASAAGVSRSTFFRYFSSKDDVLLRESQENARLFIDILRDRPASESPLRALEETLVEFTDRLGPDERRRELLPIEAVITADATLQARRAAIAARWQTEVAHALARRSGKENPDAEDDIAAAVVAQIVDRVGVEWRANEGLSAGDLIRRHFATLRRIASA